MRAACLETLRLMAKEDQRVVFIGSDLSPALTKSETPQRWFMEGVAEQNMIGMAAGMALDGLIPYCNTIATFLTRRCYDQVAVDLCMHDLPVRLIGNGGGAVYAPLGPTHLAIEDIAIMRALPNMTVVAPCDAVEMAGMMRASLAWPGPMYIRMSKGGEKAITECGRHVMIGHAVPMTGKSDGVPIVFMSTGAMTDHCLKAAELLTEYDTEVIHFHTIKPLDLDAIIGVAQRALAIVTVEEGIASGGFGTAVLEAVDMYDVPVRRLGMEDEFPAQYGTREDAWEYSGLMPDQIAEFVRISFRPNALLRAGGKAQRPQSLLPTQKRVLGGTSWVEQSPRRSC